MSLWWRIVFRRRYDASNVTWTSVTGDGALVVSLGDVTWHRVVTGVKADGDGGLVLTWGWRVDPVTPGDWWVDVLVGDVVG